MQNRKNLNISEFKSILLNFVDRDISQEIDFPISA